MTSAFRQCCSSSWHRGSLRYRRGKVLSPELEPGSPRRRVRFLAERISRSILVCHLWLARSSLLNDSSMSGIGAANSLINEPPSIPDCALSVSHHKPAMTKPSRAAVFALEP